MKKIGFIVFLFCCMVISVCLADDLSCDTDVLMTSASNIKSRPIIVIDCGHGGEDGGAQSADGVLEKDVNLKIGLVLEKMFLQGGFDVTMIRRSDVAIYDSDAETLRDKKRSDLHNRADICNSNKNNILISIHQNKFEDSRYFGTQIFYSTNLPLSKELAEYIRVAVKGLLQQDNERQCKASTDDIYILKNAQVPAVLVECGFLSNKSEAERLNNSNYQRKIAYAIYAGFLEYYYNNY